MGFEGGEIKKAKSFPCLLLPLKRGLEGGVWLKANKSFLFPSWKKVVFCSSAHHTDDAHSSSSLATVFLLSTSGS